MSWDTNGNCVTENSDWTTGVVTLSRSHPSHVMPDGLSSDQNYILSRMMLNEEGTKYMDNIQYYDGLGRPSQNVQVGITPDGEDLVTLQEYDSFGRETRQWIPTPVPDGADMSRTLQVRQQVNIVTATLIMKPFMRIRL